MKVKCIALVDFSEYSANLVKYAYQWSEKFESKLMLIHSYEIVSPGMAGAENIQHIQQSTKEEVKESLQGLINEHLPKEAIVRFSCSTKPLIYQLKEELDSESFNFVFLGVKGTGSLKRIFLGSEATRIIEESNDLIIALPKDVTSAKINKLHIAVSDEFKINTLLLANFLKLCKTNKPALHFFHLAKKKKTTPEIENLFGHLKLLFGEEYELEFNVFESDNRIEDIKKVISNKDEELLVLQRGSRYLSDQLFRKMLINELVYEGNTPLMVLP